MKTKTYKWAVIGAGPAGIATIGQLLKQGVQLSDIAWCDKQFKAGDLGQYWFPVMSNTIVKLFTQFFQVCPEFEYETFANHCKLSSLPANETCCLAYVVEALHCVTEVLKSKIDHYQMEVSEVKRTHGAWQLCGSEIVSAQRLVLALGGQARELNYDQCQKIHLETALNPEKLAKVCGADDTVAVFGSSHSSVLIMKALVEIGVKRIINFTREPLKFALNMGDWTLFDNTGLKGTAAIWARENLLDNLLPQIEQVFSNDENVARLLPECTQSVQAVGFKRREIKIQGVPMLNHNAHNGIIAPSIFGVGIAFPEETVDMYGNRELSVGMWKFVRYLEKVVPLWMQY